MFAFQLTSVAEPLQDSHVKSTNLSFLEAVLLTTEHEKDVTALFKPFCFVDNNSS